MELNIIFLYSNVKFCLALSSSVFFCLQSLSHPLWIYWFSLLYFQPFIYWVTAFFHTPHTLHILCWPQWYNNFELANQSMMESVFSIFKQPLQALCSHFERDVSRSVFSWLHSVNSPHGENKIPTGLESDLIYSSTSTMWATPPSCNEL